MRAKLDLNLEEITIVSECMRIVKNLSGQSSGYSNDYIAKVHDKWREFMKSSNFSIKGTRE